LSTLIAPIVISMLVAHMAPLAHFIQPAPRVFRLPAVLAVLANGLIQILLGTMYIPPTALVLVSMRRNRGSSQQGHAEERPENHLSRPVLVSHPDPPVFAP
jgi:hypothetical protein